MFIRRGNLEDGYVQREQAGRKQGGDLREKDGSIVGMAGVDCLPIPGTDKEGVMTEMTLQSRRGEFVAHQQQVHEFNRFQCVFALEQGTQQWTGSSGVAAGEHAVPALDKTNRLVSVKKFSAIVVDPRHNG